MLSLVYGISFWVAVTDVTAAVTVTAPTFASPATETAPAASPLTDATFMVTSPTEAASMASAPTEPAKPVVNYAGRVLERGSRKPLVDAEVVIAELGASVLTDKNGYFEFEDVPPGAYNIVIPVLGYQRLKTTEDITLTERIDVVYYLEADYGTPLEVIVEADKVKKEVSKTTLKREEIRKVPGTGSDAIKAITALPGVATSNELGSDLIVRGSGPFDNRIEIDRIEVPFIFHFGGFRSVLNSDLIDTLDFQAGGFSSSFGRATGGVLLANTRGGRRDRVGGTVDVNTAMAEGYVEGPLGEKGSYVVAGRRSYFDLIVGPIVKGTVDKDQLELTVFPQFYDYQAKFDYEVVTGTTVNAFIFGSDDVLSLLVKRVNPRDPDVTGGFLVHPYFHFGSIGAKTAAGRFTNKAMLYFGTIGQDLQIGEGNKLQFWTDTPGINDDASYRFAKWNILNFGAQLRTDFFHINARFPQPPKTGQTDFTFSDAKFITTRKTIKSNAVGLYVDDQIYITENWMIDPGVRLDYYKQDKSYAYLDPRFLTRYQITPGFAVKGAVGRYSDYGTGQELDPEFGSPELGPIHSTHYVAGVEYKITPNDMLDVQSYYKSLEDLIVSYPTGQSYRNTGIGEAYGIEIFLRHYLTQRFFGWASYAYSRSFRKSPPTNKWIPAGFDQPHIVNLVASYKLTNRWEVGLKWRFSSGNPYTPYTDRIYVADKAFYIPIPGETNSERLPNQHRMDARVEYSHPYETWTIRYYLEVWNVYGADNAADYSDNYDYTVKEKIVILPVPVPQLGIRAEF